MGSKFQKKVNIDGNRKTFYSSSKKDLEQKIKEYMSKSGYNTKQNKKQESKIKSFKNISSEYLQYICSSTSSDEYNTKEKRLEYFVEEFGDIDVIKVDVTMIQQAINKLYLNNPRTSKPTAYRTLCRYLSVCSNVFDYAIMNRYLEINPAKHVKIPKGAEIKNRECVDDNEVDFILQSADLRLLPAKIILLTGLRRGELGALQFKDIDFDKKVIYITKSLNYKTGEITLPKTKSGIRAVAIPDILVPVLIYHKEHYVPVVRYKDDRNLLMTNLQISSKVASDDDYVITHISSGMMTNHAWKQLQEGLHEDYENLSFTWHQLRHNYSSLLYNADVDVLSMKSLIGHADVKTSLSIYTHLSKEKETSSIDALYNYLDKNVFKNHYEL